MLNVDINPVARFRIDDSANCVLKVLCGGCGQRLGLLYADADPSYVWRELATCAKHGVSPPPVGEIPLWVLRKAWQIRDESAGGKTHTWRLPALAPSGGR